MQCAKELLEKSEKLHYIDLALDVASIVANRSLMTRSVKKPARSMPALHPKHRRVCTFVARSLPEICLAVGACWCDTLAGPMPPSIALLEKYQNNLSVCYMFA